MIVTRTPFRVTLGGGGTDLPSYYSQHGGFIFAMGLDKFMYVMVNRPVIGRKIRLHYSQAETVDRVDDLRHELAREALKAHGIEDAFEVASIADLPAGTGLGSSSCYLIGLLNALHHDRRDYVPLQTLANGGVVRLTSFCNKQEYEAPAWLTWSVLLEGAFVRPLTPSQPP